jgi:hypothetical protein
MSNVALEIINEQLDNLELQQPGNSEFIIDSDEKAEWALSKIREERAEAERIIMVCKAMIEKYEEKIRQVQERLPRKTAYLESKLMEYFEKVPHKKTKTQEKYELPSGTLRKKYPAPEFVRDDEALLKWIKANKINAHLYIRVKETPDWANFKKTVKVAGEQVVDENGEIVEGIRVVERPPTFEVEV